MKNFARSVALVFLIVGCRPGIAAGDTFTLTSGDVDYERYGLGNFQLVSGTAPAVDFYLSGALDAARGGTFDPAACFIECGPGSMVSLAARWTGPEMDVTAYVGRVKYDHADVTLNLSGSVRLPPPSQTGGLYTVELDTPFTVWGSLNRLPGPAGTFLTDSFTGAGTAKVFVVLSANDWYVSGVLYDVSPTPEPATVVLLGSGLVALGARKFRLGRR